MGLKATERPIRRAAERETVLCYYVLCIYDEEQGAINSRNMYSVRRTVVIEVEICVSLSLLFRAVIRSCLIREPRIPSQSIIRTTYRKGTILGLTLDAYVLLWSGTPWCVVVVCRGRGMTHRNRCLMPWQTRDIHQCAVERVQLWRYPYELCIYAPHPTCIVHKICGMIGQGVYIFTYLRVASTFSANRLTFTFSAARGGLYPGRIEPYRS